MDYRLVLSVLKIASLEFSLTADNDVSCHLTLGISRYDAMAKNVPWPVNVRYPVRKERLLNLPDCAE